ncbi:substrate-binding periplasmic protein [Colwellia psychrerythraea]|uniref:ABC-type transporter, periplasmic subunit family 3 n=1 Tax=Colwellia psychrerythraea TaxID=28229 RepID=A0A099L2M3_COLPS|nr:transporter substrate-binding domain-containing protein [Colwellia psychrerythraea]KGJ96407.1 ABC-type transporter, periplasmic subunit family 3 [Colwellia psychrerythraea]
MVIRIVFISIFFVLCSNALCCEIRFGVSESLPFTFKTDNGVWSGNDVEKFKFMAKVVGCEVLFVEGSFSERLRMLKLGMIDAMSNISKLSKRNSFLSYIGPLRIEKLSLVTTKKIPGLITSLTSISQWDYHYGKPANAYLGELFSQMYISDKNFSSKFIDIHSHNDISELIRKGRIVGFFEETNSLNHHLTSSPKYAHLKKHPLEVITGDIYFGISKKSMQPELINKLKQAFIIWTKSAEANGKND